jgi:hypothetical protein
VNNHLLIGDQNDAAYKKRRRVVRGSEWSVSDSACTCSCFLKNAQQHSHDSTYYKKTIWTHRVFEKPNTNNQCTALRHIILTELIIEKIKLI